MDGTDCSSQGSPTDTWTFTYDGDGVRVKEVYTNATDTITKYYFAGGAYEVIDEGDPTPTTKRYYSIAGMMVAMHDGSELLYFANDHLSSTSLVMNAAGGLESHNRYMPFGQIRDITGDADPIDETDFGYTSQRNNTYIKLLDYKARWYSPGLKRFISPDTIVPNPNNPQSLNRYAYVNNNPVNYIDPSGHCYVNDRYGGYIVSGVCEDDHGDVVWNPTDGSPPPPVKYNRTDRRDKGDVTSDPNEGLSTSSEGIDFILGEEGFMPCLYNDTEAWRCATGDPNDSPADSNCTVGYGHLVHYGPCEGIGNPYEQPFTAGLMTKEDAFNLFLVDLGKYEKAVKNHITVALTQYQFDALVSFSFNTGEDGLLLHGIAELVNSRKLERVPGAMDKIVYDKYDNLLLGLVERRENEGNMFLYGMYP